jgi:hypothetical protein
LKSGQELPSHSISDTILEETQSYECWFPLYDYRTQISSPLDIKQAEAYDVCGNKYTFPLSKIKKQITEQWTPERDWLKGEPA